MKVLIRADASSNIGSGHIMRCLTLALELRKNKVLVDFITRTHQANLNHLIEKQGFDAIKLKHKSPDPKLSAYEKFLGCNEQQDAQECIQHINNNHYDWVIIDHYALGQLWQKSIRPFTNKIMVIDDLANRIHDADLLLDQTYLQTEAIYKKLTPINCQLLIGTRYALLRDEFSHYREASLAKRQQHQINHIVISMGGADPLNMSQILLQELEHCSFIISNEITLIIGEQNIHRAQLKSLINELKVNVTLKVGITNMAQILSKADLAIGAAGSSAWERCCLGVPTIQVVIAENQQLIDDNLTSNNIALAYKKNTLCKQLKIIQKQLPSFSKNAAKICDGLGAQRVSQHILNMNNT